MAEAGERRDAIEQYRRALDRCPTFHDIRQRLGITLREAGLPAQAAQEFARILRLHPGMLESQIQLGLTFYSMGRTLEAIEEWNAVLEKDPSRDEARMYLRLVSGAARRAAAARSTTPSETQESARAKDDLSFAPFEAPEPTGAEPGAGNEISGWTITELTGIEPAETDS
jgi:tetratricopeptide (TPR) repeat protein